MRHQNHQSRCSWPTRLRYLSFVLLFRLTAPGCCVAGGTDCSRQGHQDLSELSCPCNVRWHFLLMAENCHECQASMPMHGAQSSMEPLSSSYNPKQQQKAAALFQRWLQVSSFRQLQKCKMMWDQLPSVNIPHSGMPRIKPARLQ